VTLQHITVRALSLYLLSLLLTASGVPTARATSGAGEPRRVVRFFMHECDTRTGPAQILATADLTLPAGWTASRIPGNPKVCRMPGFSLQAPHDPNGCRGAGAFAAAENRTSKETLSDYLRILGGRIGHRGTLPRSPDGMDGAWETLSDKRGDFVSGAYEATDSRQFYGIGLSPTQLGVTFAKRDCTKRERQSALRYAEHTIRTFRVQLASG
jgi:hypothetical protein